MKKAFILFALLFCVVSLNGQNRVDFTGHWIIESAAESSNVAFTKNIRQSETEIAITDDAGIAEIVVKKKTLPAVYSISDVETVKETEVAGGKVSVSTKAVFTAENKLEISRAINYGDTGQSSQKVVEILELLDDTKTLKITAVYSGGGKSKTIESVYKKSPALCDDEVKTSILNGKAKQLIKPAYPKEAVKEKAEGTVLVKIVIDEKGSVVMAKAFYGNPLLFKNSEEAALLCKFSPTKINNTATKVTGVIAYTFSKI